MVIVFGSAGGRGVCYRASVALLETFWKGLEVIINIDVTDWKEETEQSAIQFKTQDDIIAAMSETSMKPMQAARIATVLRETGAADKDIIPPNKVNLQLGAAHAISRRVAQQRANVQIKGQPHTVRRYVAQATTDDTGTKPELNEFSATAEAIEEMPTSEVTLVDFNDPLMEERVLRYLMTNVMGRIKERLTLLAANKCDVKAAAEALKAEIDRLVEELT